MKVQKILLFSLLTLFTACNINKSLAQTNILFEENFEDNYLHWMTGNTTAYSASVQNGHYELLQKEKGVRYFWQSVPIHPDTAYRIETVINPQLGEQDIYGLIWGVDDIHNYNAFLVSKNGEVSVVTCRGGNFETIVDWTTTANHRIGELHQLEIHYQEGELNFWLDKEKVVTTQPLSFEGGFVGFILLGQSGAKVDYLRVYQNRAIHLIEDAQKGFQKENLGLNINSIYEELHPVVAPDGQTLYITRKGHPENMGVSKKDDAWVSYRQEDGTWGKVERLGFPINNEEHNQVISISPDNNTLLLGGSGRVKERGISMVHRQEDGTWGIPEEITIDNFYNQNSVVSMHLSTSKNILLTSLERTDTKGHLDLYVSFRTSKGNFSEPQNLGAVVNTAYEDGTPFLAADGKTLYFCSAGHGGYGATDIFMTTRLDDTWTNWTVPLNLGPEINTRYWEGHYTMTAKGNSAYLVSSQGKGHIGRDDIYKVIPPLSAQGEPILLVKGKVIDAQTQLPLQSRILYYEEGATNKETGSALSNKQKGTYQMVLPGEHTYQFLTFKEGYYPAYSLLEVGEIMEYTELTQDIYLYPIEEGSTIPLNQLTFESGENRLSEEQQEELNRVVIFMEKYPLMEIALEHQEEEVLTMIQNYLEDKGVEGKRLTTQLGKEEGTTFTITSLETADKTVQRVGDFDETVQASTLRNGQVFRLEHLQYEADSATVLGASAQELLKLAAFLQKNKSIQLEIGGHTNSLPSAVYCDSLSTLRARKAVDFLIKNGVDENRLSYKGYGKKQPIATNETMHGRQRNQRIEIKIMGIGKKSQLNVSGVSTYKIVPIEPTE